MLVHVTEHSSGEGSKCSKCDVLRADLRSKESLISEVQENYDIAKKLYVKKEKELEKVKEEYKKEIDKVCLDKLKLEDDVRCLTFENEKLKSKDNTYISVFECLNEFLGSKGMKISKMGQILESNQESNKKHTDPQKPEVKFVCDECDLECNSKEELRKHKSEVHKGLTEFRCELCNVSCEDEKELMTHKKSDHGQVTHKCETCLFEADTKAKLKKHVEQVHESVDVVIETVQKSSIVYKCDQCEFPAEAKDILKAHTQEHKERINVGSFNCTGCNYIGIRKDSLEQHMRMKHVNENTPLKYVCDFYDQESVSEIYLKKHEQDVHKITKQTSIERNKKTEKVTEQNFQCDICPFVAHNDKDLNRHLENEHSFTKVNRRKIYTNEERKQNGICFHWNNGYCQFQELCRFAHEEIPQCYFDVQCRRQNCRFFHTKHNQSGHMPRFLYNRSLQHQYQDQKRHMEEGQRAQGYRR